MKAAEAIHNQSDNQNLNEVALRYRLLKSQQEQNSKILESLHAQLVFAARENGGSLQLDEFLVSAIPASR